MVKRQMKKKIVYLLIAAIMGVSFCFPLEKAAAAESFQVAAKASIAIDAKTGKILYSENGDQALPIASMTKMLTMYLVLEAIKEKKFTWTDTVAIDDYLYDLSTNNELSNVPFSRDTTYTVKELFDATAIYSANAAAIALATKVSGSETAFVDAMRKKVESWGIKDAHLISASGLNNEDMGEHIYPGTSATDENKMSAKDMAIVAQRLITDYPDFLETSKTTKQVFGEGTANELEMTNWNWMLFSDSPYYKEGVDGLKTGTTDLAGACFTGTIERNGWRIITVVMNATNAATDEGARFTETSKLMDYVYDNWSYKTLYKKGSSLSQVGKLAIENGKKQTVSLKLGQDVSAFVRKDMDLSDVKVAFKRNQTKLTAPLAQGKSLGEVTVSLNADTLGYVTGEEQSSYKMVTKEKVEKANPFVLFGRSVKKFFSNL